jgi:hypothetical protein
MNTMAMKKQMKDATISTGPALAFHLNDITITNRSESLLYDVIRPALVDPNPFYLQHVLPMRWTASKSSIASSNHNISFWWLEF